MSRIYINFKIRLDSILKHISACCLYNIKNVEFLSVYKHLL